MPWLTEAGLGLGLTQSPSRIRYEHHSMISPAHEIQIHYTPKWARKPRTRTNIHGRPGCILSYARPAARSPRGDSPLRRSMRGTAPQLTPTGRCATIQPVHRRYVSFIACWLGLVLSCTQRSAAVDQHAGQDFDAHVRGDAAMDRPASSGIASSGSDGGDAALRDATSSTPEDAAVASTPIADAPTPLDAGGRSPASTLPASVVIAERCVTLERELTLPDASTSNEADSLDHILSNELVGASVFDELDGPWKFARISETRILGRNARGEFGLIYWHPLPDWGGERPPVGVCFVDYATQFGFEVRDITTTRALLCGAGECLAADVTVRGGFTAAALASAAHFADVGWDRFEGSASSNEITISNADETVTLALMDTQWRETARIPNSDTVSPELAGRCGGAAERVFLSSVDFYFGRLDDGTSFAARRTIDDPMTGDAGALAECRSAGIDLVDASSFSLTVSPHLFEAGTTVLSADSLRGKRTGYVVR